MQKRSDKKRVCSVEGCKTVLCSYNPRRKCFVHGGWVVRANHEERAEAFQELVRS